VPKNGGVLVLNIGGHGFENLPVQGYLYLACCSVFSNWNGSFSQSYRASWYYQSFLFTNWCTRELL